jgi:thiol-disulfide isomerase/thioredoxin
LLERTGAEAAANYARFQEHDEGAGRYTEYRVAELASEDYEPTPEFAALEDFVPYARVWSEAYASSPFVIKHGGRAVRTRTLFYYTGMGKCLLLDRIGGDWKSRYFAPDVWLDDLIRDAVGAKTTLRPLEIGDAAPDFVLESVDGREVRLSELRGQVVLVDFWQWWCPPCIAAMPELSRLEDAHSELQVLGVSDRVDEAGQHRMAEVAEMVGTAYPMLLDPDAIVTRAYRVNSYPTLILVDRMGRVRWIHAGSVEGVMEDLDAAIQSALEN